MSHSRTPTSGRQARYSSPCFSAQAPLIPTRPTAFVLSLPPKFPVPGRDAIPPTPGEEPREEKKKSELGSRENIPFLRNSRAAALLLSQREPSRSSPPPRPAPPLLPRSRPERRRLVFFKHPSISVGGRPASPASPRCPVSPRGSPFPRANPAGVRVQCRRPALGPSPSCSRRHVGGGHRPGLSELLCRCGPRRRHRDNR